MLFATVKVYFNATSSKKSKTKQNQYVHDLTIGKWGSNLRITQIFSSKCIKCYYTYQYEGFNDKYQQKYDNFYDSLWQFQVQFNFRMILMRYPIKINPIKVDMASRMWHRISGNALKYVIKPVSLTLWSCGFCVFAWCIWTCVSCVMKQCY